MPVCGSDQAWRFSCVHPVLLAHDDDPLRGKLDAECLLFWTVVRPGVLPSGPLARLAPSRPCVHVLAASRMADALFPTLDAALAHHGTFMLVHVSEKGPGTPAKRLKATLGAEAVVAVLSPADRCLVLPAAWVQQHMAKCTGVHVLSRLFAWLVRHGPGAAGPVAAAAGAQLRAFLHAATPAGACGRALAGCLPPGLCSILHGQHWIVGQKLPSWRACLGFLPKSWLLIRDLLSLGKGRPRQNAHGPITQPLTTWW